MESAREDYEWALLEASDQGWSYAEIATYFLEDERKRSRVAQIVKKKREERDKLIKREEEQ
jgi:hypothetical protein